MQRWAPPRPRMQRHTPPITGPLPPAPLYLHAPPPLPSLPPDPLPHPAAPPTHARPLPLQYYRDLRRAAGKKAFFRAIRALAPQLQYLRRAGGFPPSPKLDGWVEEGREGGGERLGKTPKRSLRRYDTDGGLYTKADFVWEYGGTAEWDAAKRQLAARAAPQAQMQPPP